MAKSNKALIIAKDLLEGRCKYFLCVPSKLNQSPCVILVCNSFSYDGTWKKNQVALEDCVNLGAIFPK